MCARAPTITKKGSTPFCVVALFLDAFTLPATGKVGKSVCKEAPPALVDVRPGCVFPGGGVGAKGMAFSDREPFASP